MIDFKKIISKTKFKKKDRTKINSNPSRDWKIIVISFFVLFIIVFGGNYYLHGINIKPIDTEGDGGGNIKTVNIDDINAIVSEINSKKEAFTDYSSKSKIIIDPS